MIRGTARPNPTLVALLLLAWAGMIACSREEDKRLTIGGVTYTFPARDVRSFTEAGEGSPFARVRPRGQLFDLIYSARARYRRNHQGDGTPLVTSVNDHSSSSFERYDSSGFVTVCRGGQPYFSCGMNVEDRGVTWTIVFTRDQLPDAPSVRASAIQALQKYGS